MPDFNLFGLGNFIEPYDFTDKRANTKSYIVYMLNRLLTMFEYEGLPDTIPQKILELYIMVNGHSVVIEHEGKLYVCFGGWGGEPNEYYIPKNYIVANPYLDLFNTYEIDTDCVLVHNDSMYYGMLPLLRRYASAMVENDLSMNLVNINSRITALIDAADDKTKASAEKYLSDIANGKLGVIASTAFFNGVRAQPYGERNAQRLTDLIEYQQYMKASWYNEIGLNANYNMKREAITANESQLNDDMLLPLIDDMFNCRKAFCDKINNMWGTDITVNWASAWKNNDDELNLMKELMESEIEGGDEDEESENDERDVSESDIG